MPMRSSASQADLAECRALLRCGSRSFHLASLLLPRAVRAPAAGLYAFCRVADDAIDGGGGAAALRQLQARLDGIYAGRPAAVPADRAMAELVACFALPRALPEALLEGFAWDAAGRRYATIDELHAYAARVAGTVGAMMAVIMGARGPEALARACDLGVAMQLSNIARDVGEDARAGRLYLPEDWLREAGIDPDAWLAAPRFGPALAGVIARLLAHARALYVRARPGIARLPLGCRPAIHAAGALYAEIGAEVARRGFDSITSRAVVAPGRKAAVLAMAARHVLLPPREDSMPALAETRYLVEAASWSHRPAPAMPGLEARVAWLVELFARLEQRQLGAGP